MCKSKMSTQVIESVNSRPITPKSSRSTSRTSDNFHHRHHRSSSITDPSSSSNPTSLNYTTTGSSYRDSSKSSISSRTSLSSLKDSLLETSHIYDFAEICSVTTNFLAKRFSSSSSSSSWRCTVRGKDVIVFQRKFRRLIDMPELKRKLSLICRSHHSSLIKLHGVSISGNYIYLVYDYVQGANLVDSLRNPKNPSFTVLSSWLSRMQIATDLAHGLDYIHHCTGINSGFVHNHIKSTSIIVTESTLNAKICHFGTAELCGEVVEEQPAELKAAAAASSSSSSSRLTRSDSRGMKFEGTRGYMAPEFQSTGTATRETDVFAFGVVILELLSGKEALKYCFDEESGAYSRVSVIETAREAVRDGGGGGGGLRTWVDRRMKDSYPVEVAEKMVRVGLECVEADPGKRPDMGRVAGWISRLYLESKSWADQIGLPTDFSVSIAPR